MRIITAIIFSFLASICFAEYYDDEEAERIVKKGEIVAGGYDLGFFRVLVKYRKNYYECLTSVSDEGLIVDWCQGK